MYLQRAIKLSLHPLLSGINHSDLDELHDNTKHEKQMKRIKRLKTQP